MRVKTFRGASAAQVMAQIKKELGPDAVILSNQTRREDGRQICEIMAAVEPAQDIQDPTPAAGPDLPGAPARGAAWEREWHEMKGHLSALLKPHLSLDGLAPRQKTAMEYLEREGVEEALLVGLLRKLKSASGVSILAELGRLAHVKPYGQFAERFQLVAGPSGAGKTTALARMALEAKRRAPDKRIGILNCDGRGAGGKAILKRYAELSGITFADAPEPEDFVKVLMACRNFDTIYVDLPSLSPGQTLAQWLDERSLTQRDDVAVHLVLPPYMSQAHYQGLWKRHAAAAVKSIVWTKLDEADTFGNLINVGHMTGLPASAFSRGPGVAGAMPAADAQALWRLLFSHQMPGVEAASNAVEQAA